MAIIADKYYNLKDHAAQFGENGLEAGVAEVLTQTNEIIDDALMLESNLDSGHLYNVRTGIPEGTWRRLYQGVEPVKATTKTVTEGYGELAAFSLVDKSLAEMGGMANVQKVRTAQSKGILQGLSDQMAYNLIYGNNGVTPERFTGFAARYNTLNKKVESSKNVIDAKGSEDGNLSSIFLVVWGQDKVFTFFPKGSKAGIERVDYGLSIGEDGEHKEYPAYKEFYMWKMGLAVPDWRYAGRIVNVPENPTKDLLDNMMDLEERIQSLTSGKPVWYMNKRTKGALRRLLNEKANVNYSSDKPTARPTLMFDEIPVHVCEAISNTEGLIK